MPPRTPIVAWLTPSGSCSGVRTDGTCLGSSPAGSFAPLSPQAGGAPTSSLRSAFWQPVIGLVASRSLFGRVSWCAAEILPRWGRRDSIRRRDASSQWEEGAFPCSTQRCLENAVPTRCNRWSTWPASPSSPHAAGAKVVLGQRLCDSLRSRAFRSRRRGGLLGDQTHRRAGPSARGAILPATRNTSDGPVQKLKCATPGRDECFNAWVMLKGLERWRSGRLPERVGTSDRRNLEVFRGAMVRYPF